MKFDFKKSTIKNLAILLVMAMLTGCGNSAAFGEHGTVNGTPTPIVLSPTVAAWKITPSPTFTPTATPVPTVTPEPTATTAPTATPEPSAAELTPAEEVQPTAEPTVTTEAAEASPTETPGPTATPTNTPTPTPTPVMYSKNGSTEGFPAFSGKAYVVCDGDGTVLLSANADKTLYPASTMKMLTALTLMDYCKLTDEMTATEENTTSYKDYAYTYCHDVLKRESSLAGMTYTMDVWMHIMLMCSAADASTLMADYAGKAIAGSDSGNINDFIAAMNKKAQSLGMTATKVDNTIGLDINNGYYETYTTAADMSKLAAAFMKNEDLAKIVATVEYTVPACTIGEETIDEKLIKNSNQFYTKPTVYYSDMFKVVGTKTGSTANAGYCLVTTAVTTDGRTLICCCFGEQSTDAMYRETIALLEYCLTNE